MEDLSMKQNLTDKKLYWKKIQNIFEGGQAPTINSKY